MRFNRRTIYAILLLFVLGTFQNCGAPKDQLNSNASASGDVSTIPSAPNQFTAVAKSAQQIDLRWSDNSNNESGFRIERFAASSGPFSGSGGAFVLIHTTAADETTYSDFAVSANTPYTYRVSAANAAGVSPVSASADATTPIAPTMAPTAPSLLAAAAQAATLVEISWSDNSNNESYFKVERSINGGLFAPIASTSADVHLYEDINLNPATTYTYRVRATNSVGDSAFTNVGSTTTPAAGNVNAYSYLSVNVIAPNCVACHGGGITAGGIDLASYNTVKTNRFLMTRAVNANTMPPGAPLTATQKSQLSGWVNAGAPNN